MPVTQSDIDALNTAIASGERRVTLGSQSITYASIAELIQARDDMRRQLTEQSNTAPRRRTQLYYGGRGYH
ncbi:phage head-tail joining protein [Cupriavidus sp. IK-TO18]|uniref:phage head-tail joining protein n=1 Tax=Cupriavidus sp. IK-TO18 TaxID=2782182 RepID=UPI001896AEDF|nr:hypothetical protein [Cupriavidus sp. IK-TO18]MBF6987246.1 hypothetical protein [Cupriavidus sp. IK-TO18]